MFSERFCPCDSILVPQTRRLGPGSIKNKEHIISYRNDNICTSYNNKKETKHKSNIKNILNIPHVYMIQFSFLFLN